MTPKNDSSLARMLGVLDLFDDTHLTRTVDEIAAHMGMSLPTVYRYLRMLLEAGLLQRVQDSVYTLGPRIILLDHYIRKADPLLREGIPVMRELVQRTGFDCVTTALYGQLLLDTHREMSGAPQALAYGRGRPRPLFQGAAAKVILASFAPAPLHRLFDARTAEIAAAGLPTQWSEFRRYYAAIRKTGHYLSVGELEPQLAAIAAPITKADGGIWGAISLVFEAPRAGVVHTDRLALWLVEAARRIADRLC